MVLALVRWILKYAVTCGQIPGSPTDRVGRGHAKGKPCACAWPDVDFKNRMVTIRHSYEGTSKSGRHRTVPIPPELVKILQEHKLADPWNGGPRRLVFPNDSGEMW